MKRTYLWVVILLLTLVVGATRSQALVSTTSGSPALDTPTPVLGTPRPLADGSYADTHDAPIHMPDLLGRTLAYATTIWDDDEPLPQILVRERSRAPDTVVVAQWPAPGSVIVPAHTRIFLTLDRGPLVRPPIKPARAARLANRFAISGQATLLRSPYVQNVTTTSLVIVWTTVEDGPSEVQYGLTDFALTAPASSTFFTTASAAPYDQYYVHEATLSGLAPASAYQYKIVSNGVDLTPGGFVTTHTAKPPSATQFRVAVLGDSGDGSQNQIDVAARLLQVQPDLAIHVGDLIYNEATYDGYETKYFQIYKDFIKSTWMAPTLGNHDVTYNNGQSFTDVFVNPSNAANASERELYYSFDYGNAHFTVLNNYFGMSAIGSAQYTWLKNDLATATQFWKFVVFHVPAYTSESNQAPGDDPATVQNLAPLFEQYHVNMVLTGHKHWYRRMKPLLQGQVSSIGAGGVVYLVTGGGGAGLFAVGSGLNPRTAAKAQEFHLTTLDITGCSLQLSAVRKVSGPGDTFDTSDVFDSYTLNRCGGGGPPTATPTPVNGAIFSDDFETGDFSKWTSTVLGAQTGAVKEVIPGAAFAGALGAHLGNGVGGAVAKGSYVYRDFTAPATGVASVQTRIKVNTIAGTGALRLLQFRDSPSGQSMLRVRYLNGVAQLYLLQQDGTNVTVNFTSNLTTGVWHTLELLYDWSGSQPVGQAWVDGVLQATLTDTTSGTAYTANRLTIQTYEETTTAAADLYFDDVQLANIYIGKGLAPTPTPTSTPTSTPTAPPTPTKSTFEQWLPIIVPQ